MKKNKDGSTLITTVIILMFITTVSLEMLSMVSTNYYGRVGESKRTQNLYGSESGLDTTYNIIVKTVDVANHYGSQRVQDMKDAAKHLYEESDKEVAYNEFNKLQDSNVKALYALYEDIDYWKYYNGIPKKTYWPKEQKDIDAKIQADNEAIYNLTNKVFKDGFKDFIKEGKTNDPNKTLMNIETSINSGKYIEVNGGTPEEQQLRSLDGTNNVYMGYYQGKNLTQTEIEELKNKKDNMLNPKGKDIDNTSVFGDKQSVSLWMEVGYDESTENGEVVKTIKYGAYTPDNMSQFNFNKEEEYVITVTSEFQTNSSEENTVKVGINEKVVEASYSIRVPNYDEIALKNSVVNVEPKSYQVIPNLAIGGDLQVDGVNQFVVNGDIFVQGNDLSKDYTDTKSRIPNKYMGGIQLNNDLTSSQKTIIFNKNVYTRGTFNIQDNVNVSVNKDLYARNIYAGNGNDSTNNSQLTVNNDVVVDNDLTLKALTTTINLKNFYGINDKYSEDNNTNINTKVRNSSSIIVNNYTNDGSNNYGIKITDDAYIRGVAHINNENGYQTGESVAVKGNYKAYSVPDDNGIYTFEDKDPADTVTQKATNFWNYWNGNSAVDCGGVYLNPDKVYSIGAIVYNDQKVKDGSEPNQSKEDIITEKKENYAKNIYAISKNKSFLPKELYSLWESMGGDNPETVKGLLTDVTDYNFVEQPNGGTNFAVFSTADDGTIVIEGDKATKDYNSTDKCKVINAKTNKNVNAVIITKGNIIIDGDVNFKGNIIAGGNLQVFGGTNSTVKITHDEELTKNILDNLDENKLDDGGLDIKSNSINFIKSKLWKIVQ